MSMHGDNKHLQEPSHGEEALKTRPLDVLFTVCSSLFLMPFMLSSVGVALPNMGTDLHATAVELGLVETFYVMSLTIFLLMSGRLGDIYGRRTIFRWGVGVFSLSTCAVGLAPTIETLILLRFMQGIGASMVNATGLAMIVTVYPKETRGRALGICSAVVYAGISCGPILGGFITSTLGWRYIFLLALPLGCTAWWVAMRRLKDEWSESAGESFDIRGSVLYAGGIIFLTLGASGEGSAALATLLVTAGLALLAFFVWMQTKTQYPLLNIGIFVSNAPFALGCLSACINYASITGMMLFMSLYLQIVQGMSASSAGLMLALQPIVQMVLSPWGGRLADTYPPSSVATVGMICSGISLVLAAQLNATSSLYFTALVQIIMGIGLGLFASANTLSIMTSVAKRYLGVASGMTGTMRTFGMMTSMLVVTISFSFFMKGEPASPANADAFLQSMHVDFMLFAGISFVGVALSLFRLNGTKAKQ